jgi:rhodanese-related sulfurtransferase
MTVQQFGNILKDADLRATYQIIDVREANELEVARIAGDDIIHLPLSEADAWSGKVANGSLLDSEKPTLCLCKVGNDKSALLLMFSSLLLLLSLSSILFVTNVRSLCLCLYLCTTQGGHALHEARQLPHHRCRLRRGLQHRRRHQRLCGQGGSLAESVLTN